MTEDDEVHKPEGHIAGRGRAEGVIGIRIYEVPGEGFGVKLDTNDHGCQSSGGRVIGLTCLVHEPSGEPGCQVISPAAVRACRYQTNP